MIAIDFINIKYVNTSKSFLRGDIYMKIGTILYFILSLVFVFLATLVNIGFSTILFQSAIFFGFLIIMRIKLDEDLSNMILGLFSVAPAVFCIGIINKYDLFEHFGEYLSVAILIICICFPIIFMVWWGIHNYRETGRVFPQINEIHNTDIAVEEETQLESKSLSPDPTLNNK